MIVPQDTFCNHRIIQATRVKEDFLVLDKNKQIHHFDFDQASAFPENRRIEEFPLLNRHP